MTQQQTSYIFRGGMVTVAGLLVLFVLYSTLGWIIIASTTASLTEAKQQYDLMFPEWLREYGARQMITVMTSVAALVLALAGLRYVEGFRRTVAYVIIILAPLLGLLNIWWLM